MTKVCTQVQGLFRMERDLLSKQVDEELAAKLTVNMPMARTALEKERHLIEAL